MCLSRVADRIRDLRRYLRLDRSPSVRGVKKSGPRAFQSRAKARFAILAPRSARGFGSTARVVRPRRRPLQNLAPPEHFVATASAAAKLGHVRFPRAERGAKIVKRAFARDRGEDERDGLPSSLDRPVSSASPRPPRETVILRFGATPESAPLSPAADRARPRCLPPSP